MNREELDRYVCLSDEKKKNKIQKSRPYKVLSKPPDDVHDVNLRAVKM